MDQNALIYLLGLAQEKPADLKASVDKATGALDTMTHLINSLLDITELKVKKAPESESKGSK